MKKELKEIFLVIQGTIIFTVKAEDGDFGNQRNITYDIDQS
jgi:hypothetical protein